MTTKQNKVEVFRERAYCDCGGELVRPPVDPYEACIDAINIIGPKTYKHVCDKCGKTEYLDSTYPRLIYKEINHENLD